MFGKNQKAKVMDPQVKGMAFTELVSQELDNEMNRLRKEEKEITTGINEVLAAIKGRGSDNNELAAFVADLRQKQDKNQKEIKQAGVKYVVDLDLKIMAGTLDRADGTNKGIDLFRAIGPKVNEILAMLPEIEKCYGSEYYAPILFTQIKKGMQGLAGQFNCEWPKLRKVDKEALKQKLNDRMELLRADKEETSTVTARFKNL